MTSEKPSGTANGPPPEIDTSRSSPNLTDPRAVLALLETDQVVAEKQRTRFGLRKFSLRLRTLLWSLRIYVVLMLVIVGIAVLRAIHALH